MNNNRIIFAVAHVTMLFACGRWAYAETTTINGIRWTYTIMDGEASVGDWSASQTAIPTSTRGDVAIPKVLDGCPVVGIMDGAFKGCASIRSVTMPEGVTSIGKGAFNGCSNLKSITIPKGVSVIEKDVFGGCISLASIALPDGIVEISEHSFAGCDTLKSISLPQTLLKIGPASFDGCGRLAELTLPEGVIEIRAWTLARTGLRNFTFPSGISRINNNMFFCCKDLVSVTIPNGVTEIGGWVFQGCTQLKSVTIPDSVKRVGDHAFIDCTSLRSIKIPSGVTWIGGDAFKNCQSLRSLSLPVCLKGNTYNLGIPPRCKVSFSDEQDDGDSDDDAEATLSDTGQPPPSAPEENAAQLQVPMAVHAADQPRRPCTSPLVIDVSSMSKAYDASGISMYKCKSALKDFEKAVENANLAAAAHREKIAEMTKAYLNNCLVKAQEAGDLDRVVAFKKAIETADDEISGDLEEIAKLRSGREDRLARLNQGLVTTCLNAARTLNVSLDFQKKEMTKKGDIEEAQKIAAFQKLVLVWANETKAKVAAAPPVAVHAEVQPKAYSQPPQPVRELKTIEPVAKTYTIQANDRKGTMIGHVKAGDVIVFQYIDGKWNGASDEARLNPDNVANYWTEVALVNLEKNCILAVIPTGTKATPFEFEVEESDAGKIGLKRRRFHDKDSGGGSVRYSVKIILGGKSD